MILHRLVEINCGNSRSIKSGQPHRTYKDQSERIVRVLEFGLHVFLDHTKTVRPDVESFFLKHIHFVLLLRHDHCHVGVFHELDLALEFSTFPDTEFCHVLSSQRKSFSDPENCGIRPDRNRHRRQLSFQSAKVRLPVFLDFVIHPDRSQLVDADHHSLAALLASHEVGDNILSHFLHAIVASDQVIFTSKLSLQLLLLISIQFCRIDQSLKIILEAVIRKLQFGNAIFIEQRNGGSVFD